MQEIVIFAVEDVNGTFDEWWNDKWFKMSDTPDGYLVKLYPAGSLTRKGTLHNIKNTGNCAVFETYEKAKIKAIELALIHGGSIIDLVKKD